MVNNFTKDTLLVTLDVKLLYTNIRNIQAIKAAKHTLDRHRVDNAPVTNNDIIRLFILVLRCNNFEFNNSPYLQMHGAAMGTRIEPTVANLVMREFEVKWVHTYDLQPILWSGT